MVHTYYLSLIDFSQSRLLPQEAAGFKFDPPTVVLKFHSSCILELDENLSSCQYAGKLHGQIAANQASTLSGAGRKATQWGVEASFANGARFLFSFSGEIHSDVKLHCLRRVVFAPLVSQDL